MEDTTDIKPPVDRRQLDRLVSQLFYAADGVKIYNANCRDVMAEMPDNFVDVVVTDPPYGETTHAGARTRTIGANSDKLISFDSMTGDEAVAVFREMLRVTRRWVIATCEWRHAALFEAAGLPLVRLGVWVKPNSAPQLTGDRPATGWEAVAILHKPGAKRWNGGGSRAVWTHNRVDAVHHPSEKPIGLVSEWIRDFSDSNETVFDPFSGSGTTLVAAKLCGRHAIGVELNREHCETAKKRLAQRVLFPAG